MRIVIASHKGWHAGFPEALGSRTGHEFVWIRERQELTLDRLSALSPRYVFFPHWSYLIPAEIHERYECVIFHMTDVPFGRGGSPLQNLISRGIYETKISALRCVSELDAGPVYLKRDFCLREGSAEDLYRAAARIIEDMIVEIVERQLEPASQSGTPVVFRRRKPSESNIADLENLQQLYDYIRMLDADGYPHAFLETSHLRLEFRQARQEGDVIVSQVSFSEKPKV